MAPAGTPRETVNRLNADILKAMQLADVRQRLIDGGSDLIGSTPEAAERFLREEVEKWGKVVRVANVKPN